MVPQRGLDRVCVPRRAENPQALPDQPRWPTVAAVDDRQQQRRVARVVGGRAARRVQFHSQWEAGYLYDKHRWHRPGTVDDRGNVQRRSCGSGGSMGESGSAPLQGFSKRPSEEAVKSPTPPMVAKADTAEIAARQAREAAKRQLTDIYFAYDKWALSNEGMKNLAQNADLLRQNATVKILIEGHCDERGSREYNMVLGEKRAQETRRYLEALGVRNTVTVTSYR